MVLVVMPLIVRADTDFVFCFFFKFKAHPNNYVIGSIKGSSLWIFKCIVFVLIVW